MQHLIFKEPFFQLFQSGATKHETVYKLSNVVIFFFIYLQLLSLIKYATICVIEVAIVAIQSVIEVLEFYGGKMQACVTPALHLYI